VADIRVAGERLVFDAGVWDEEVERFDRDGLAHRCAIQARRVVERRLVSAVPEEGLEPPTRGL